MAIYTPNLNLKKPSTGEYYDVVAEDNDAKDKIDLAVGTRAIKTDMDAELVKKRDKSTLINMADLGQDVKTGMTGGSVAVVGVNAVNKANIAEISVTKNKLDAKIQELLQDQFSNYPLTLSQVGFYGRAGQNYTTAGYVKQAVTVSPGEIYKITGWSYLSMPMYVLLDSLGAAISTYPVAEVSTVTKYSDILVKIPNNAATLCLNVLNDGIYPLTMVKDSSYKIDGTKVTKNYMLYGEQLFNNLSMVISGFWVAPEGLIKASATSKYAKIPVKANEFISMWRGDSRSYLSSNSGSLVFLDSGSNVISFFDPSTMLNIETYNNYNYVTFKTPVNCAYIAYTTKLSTTYDIGLTLLVIYGHEITQEVLINHEIFKIDDIHIVDKLAREYIYNQNKIYVGKKWVYVGDSLTEKNLRSTLNYQDYIIEELGFTGFNMGRSGSGYMRTQDEGFAFYQRVLSIPTDANVVTVFGSFNDIGGGYALGEIADTGTTTICGCVNTFFDNYYSKLPTIPIGVILPTPWIGSYPGIVTADNYVNKLIGICEKRSIPYLDLYHGSNLRPWNATFRTLAYSKDEGNGVHPDETGHKIISSKIREFVKALI